MNTGTGARLAFLLGLVMLIGRLVASPGSPVHAQARSAPRGQPAVKDPCVTPTNRVVAENCKPGHPSTEWDVNGGGDPSIQGFSTDVSYNVGEKAQFKVLTNASAYRIDIYRTGYYGGLGARLVTTVRPIVALPQRQPPCKEDWSVRLYDCGTWGVSAAWNIPADAVSGVYMARLVREDPGGPTWRNDNAADAPAARPAPVPHAYGALGMGKLRNPLKEPRASQIMFVVRDDASKSDIVVQTSDEAWAAYNPYGLGSSYGGRTANEVGGTRAYKVSLNRVNVNRGDNATNNFFHAEYALARFLERNGYDVTYQGGIDGDRHGALLKNHKMYISVGHDEYWSGPQRKNVEAARDAGVNLVFMSGNDVFWKTRYEASIDGTNTPYRTIAIYKDTHERYDENGQQQPHRRVDPDPNVWTGTWRDDSPLNPGGPQPENALTGTIFTGNANAQEPVAVPAKFAKLRFWRNTEVAKLTGDELLVLGNGLVGHEFNEDVDNGFRPAGLIHLSEITLDGVNYIQDQGSRYDSGTAAHAFTLYRAKSGALVFSGATVQFAWALDNFHDSPSAVLVRRAYLPGVPSGNSYSHRVSVDQYGPVKAIQQATVNLFADMGVQPASLEPDLVPAAPSTDKTAPFSKIASPADGTTVAGGTVTIAGTASDAGGGVVAAVEVSVDGGKTWHPATGTGQWTYRWAVPEGSGLGTILSRASDDSVNVEAPNKGITVSHGRVTAPTGAAR